MLKHLIRTLLVFVISISPFVLVGQVLDDTQFRTRAQQGLDLMYNLNFEKAHQTFSALQTDYNSHPGPPFLMALNRWWQTYLSVTMPDYYEFIEDQLEVAMDKLEDLEDDDTYAKELPFFAFMIHALDARAHSYRNEWWAAMGAARRLINPMEASLEQEGAHPEYAMVNGVYRYYVATYHRAYPVIRPVLSFFPDGDEARGLRDLEEAGRNGGVAQIEAQFFLGTIYRDETHQYQKGVQVSKALANRFPRNSWFQNDYARALILAEDYASGTEVLTRLIQKYEGQSGSSSRNITSRYSRFPTYMMMRVYHNMGYVKLMDSKDYNAAIAYFAKSDKMAQLSGVEEDSYLPANQYYTGLCQDYLGKREQAVKAYEAVLDLEENEAYKARAKAGIKSPASAR